MISRTLPSSAYDHFFCIRDQMLSERSRLQLADSELPACVSIEIRFMGVAIVPAGLCTDAKTNSQQISGD